MAAAPMAAVMARQMDRAQTKYRALAQRICTLAKVTLLSLPLTQDAPKFVGGY